MDTSSKTSDSTPAFCGDTAPPPALTALLRSCQPCTLFDSTAPDGDYTVVLQEVEGSITALQRNALPLAAADIHARRVQFLTALLAVDGSAAQRVQVLGQLGEFRFRPSESAESRKRKLTAVVSDAAGDELHAQVDALMAIWRPESGSFADALLHRPTEAARLLGRRPMPSLIDHPLDGLGTEGRHALVGAGVVAWHEEGAVHLVGGVADYLRTCADPDSTAPSGLTPLHLLLLHDAVTDQLRRSTQLDATARQLVAAAFVGCLSNLSLSLAAESFFVAWESRQAPVADASTVAPAGDIAVDDEAWMDCIISHDDLRPEAYEERTLAEQRAILREMFGEDWSYEDEVALEGQALSAA